MRIAKVTGVVTATVKDVQLIGHKLLLVDIVDAQEKVLEPSWVVTDVCGAGLGERVLVTCGSAARVSVGTSGIATDATAVAIIDEISLGR